MQLQGWLAHPLTSGLDLDHPRTTLLRREILRQKRFLRRIYEEWYAALSAELPRRPGPVLEIGSGAGFLADFIPGLITSEIVPLSGMRCALDAGALPIADQALRAIVGTNVLHHLGAPRAFFAEAARALAAGGVVALIEPWVTRWSRFVYTRVDHEPFAPQAGEWELPAAGPLSGANGALPWILFCRDRRQFEREFPLWQIRSVRPFMPIRYLLSGGLALRISLPGWSSALCRLAESWIERWSEQTAMFARIVLEKRAGPETNTDGNGPQRSRPWEEGDLPSSPAAPAAQGARHAV